MATDSPARRSRRRVPFLGHEIAEYTVGAALIAAGLHVRGGDEFVLVAGGSAIALVNVLTAGPLGVWRLLNRRWHHGADLVVAAGLAVSPAFALHPLGTSGIVCAEILAVLLVWMERLTRYEAAPPRRPAPAPRVARRSLAESAGARAGAAAGTMVPVARAKAHTSVRRLGVVAGTTRRLARERAAARREAPPPPSS